LIFCFPNPSWPAPVLKESQRSASAAGASAAFLQRRGRKSGSSKGRFQPPGTPGAGGLLNYKPGELMRKYQLQKKVIFMGNQRKMCQLSYENQL